MPGPERSEAVVETTRSLKRKRLPLQDQAALESLERIVKRIQTIVPRVPYILSIPSQHPYRYHSQYEANAWMMGRFWRHDEEHQQYRTFLYREHGQDCFELQAGEEDEPEPDMSKSQASVKTVKKKMNLSAFKVKQVNGSATPGSMKESPNLGPTKHRWVRSQDDGEVETAAVCQAQGQQLPPRTSHASQDGKPRRASDAKQDSEPRQRLRTLSQKSESHVRSDSHRPDSSSSTPHGLPPLLSPVDEPLGNPYGLPDILSPTLPSSIQAELDKLTLQQKPGDSNASTSSGDVKGQSLPIPRSQAQKGDGVPMVESHNGATSFHGKSPNALVLRQPENSRRSLVAILKFSKSKIPTVKQILRLLPKRNVEKKEGQDDSEDALPLAKAPVIKKKPVPKVAARRAPEPSPPPPRRDVKTIKIAGKRPRAEQDTTSAVSSKRPKTTVTSSQDRPITPVQQMLSSPAPSNEASAQRSQGQYLTPKGDVKAANMLRTLSTESHDTTPGRSGGTPAGARVDRVGPTSVPLNSRKQADMALLAEKSRALNQMGRGLKHEAHRILTTPGDNITEHDKQKAAVLNVECILSYMAAYHASDVSLSLRHRPADVDGSWKTLLPVATMYARSTTSYPHLDGLLSYLSSFIASAIVTHVAQRAATSQPHDSPQHAPHPELVKSHLEVVSNLSMLADYTKQMRTSFRDARASLPMEDVQSTYARTWAARARDVERHKDVDKSGVKLSGPFHLPLGPDTSPIQAVRFGLRFLEEYCQREGLKYRLRVQLD